MKIGSLEKVAKSVDEKGRTAFPANWKESKMSQDFYILTPEQRDLIKELRTSRNKILAIITETEEDFPKFFKGENFFDEVASNIESLERDKGGRFILPTEVRNQMKIENRIKMVRHLGAIVLVGATQRDLLKRKKKLVS